MANNVWFVTGASKGIGLLLVQQLLTRGYRVGATSRSVEELVKRVGAASERFLPLAMEIVDEGSVGKAVAATRAHFGALDVVVNNAGYGQFGAVEEVSDAEARRNYDVNVFGTLNVLRAALPQLREQRSGHVFNISSIGGLVGGFSGWGVYCSTKFAVAGLTESLRADLEPLGVKVTLVYPGYFRTEFLTSGSLSRPARRIAAYAGARESEAAHTDQINGAQPGDPVKAARALIDVYERADAPLHLLLGSDAVSMAEKKLQQVQQELGALRALSVSTDF
ncbi:MAG TPA: SDR family NAD(P)-dependent oxidoreductase [Polyangiaceae bacterium]|nr:SDR family NAD(P)-dependent oxidoreductase [Polyangiaceae bacterium]